MVSMKIIAVAALTLGLSACSVPYGPYAMNAYQQRPNGPYGYPAYAAPAPSYTAVPSPVNTALQQEIHRLERENERLRHQLVEAEKGRAPAAGIEHDSAASEDTSPVIGAPRDPVATAPLPPAVAKPALKPSRSRRDEVGA